MAVSGGLKKLLPETKGLVPIILNWVFQEARESLSLSLSSPPVRQILGLFQTSHISRIGLFTFLATWGNVCCCHLLGYCEDP